MNDAASARALYKAFTPVFERYDHQKGFVGRYDERDFDYWKFLGHELLITLTATLLREERYETITAILNEIITIATNRRTLTITFDYASAWLRSLEPRQNETRRLSLHADLLHQRHARKEHDNPDEGPLADLLPFDQFIAADYFLYLRGELDSDTARERGFAWKPWSSAYLEEAPDFINSATRTPIATQLATALGTPDVATMKKRLMKRAGRLGNLWGPLYDQPLTKEHIDRIGTR
jgi:hypothetical protein